MTTHQCKYCKNNFESMTKNRIFCSNSCRAHFNAQNELRRKRISEGLKNSEKYKEACKLRETKLIEFRKNNMKNLWAIKKDIMIERQKQFYSNNIQFLIDRAFKINTKERNEKIRLTALNFYKHKFNNGLTNNRFENFLKRNDINFKKNYSIAEDNFDYYLNDYFALIYIDKNALYKKERNFTQEEINEMTKIEQARSSAELSGYKFLIITTSEFNHINKIQDLFDLGRKTSRREEIAKEDISKAAILYGALPLI